MNASTRVRSVVGRARSRMRPPQTFTRLLQEYRYKRLLRRMAGPKLIRAFADAYPEAFFVEVGSNDGEKYDHLSAIIHAGVWRGIMVEPVPYVFERLRRNYGNDKGVILENVAIADRDSKLPFYYLAQVEGEQGVPDWYDAIGSFVLETILGHRDKIPDLESRIVRTDVPSMTFQSLCAKHAVERVDLILVDTEGYDWEVVKNIDFSIYHPRLMVYEHFHLSPDVRAEARRYLEGLGYETKEEGFDTFCLDTRIEDRLTHTWRRLTPAIAGAYVETEARPSA